MSCLAAGLTIDPSSLPKVDTIADKLQRKKEQEAGRGRGQSSCQVYHVSEC
jgi:hypothetical protein